MHKPPHMKNKFPYHLRLDVTHRVEIEVGFFF